MVGINIKSSAVDGFERREKIFRNIIANLAIILSVLIVITMTVSDDISTVFTQGQLKAIYRGDSTKKNISLMVNVYWGTEYIDKMLNIMEEENVKVTFFVGGSWVADNNDMLVKLVEKGHEIGNHGYYHKDHKTISEQRNREEIFITHELIKSVAGVTSVLFAPPSGAFGKTTLKVADELGYKTIMWSKDTIDWKYKDTQWIHNRATRKPENGDLILMHPTYNTLEALRGIIKELKSKGFALVTVGENIADLKEVSAGK